MSSLRPDSSPEEVAAARASEGVKFDDGKVRYDLLPFDALEEVAKVLTHGGKKYGDHNWAKGMPWHQPFRALINHSWAWWRGENLDPESGLHHLAHATCNCLFLLAYVLRGLVRFDDRPQVDADCACLGRSVAIHLRDCRYWAPDLQARVMSEMPSPWPQSDPSNSPKPRRFICPGCAATYDNAGAHTCAGGNR